MIVAVDIVLSLFLIATGYYAACNFLKYNKFYSKDINTLSVNRNRILYLLSELLVCGILIALFQRIYQLDMISQLKLLSLVLALFPIAVVDYRLQKIPNQMLIIALLIRIAFYIFEFVTSPIKAWTIFKDNVFGALVIGLFFLLLLLVFKNSIGMGDVKLFALIGLYQGLWGTINSVFFSLLTCFVISVFLLITKKKGKKDAISFAPSVLVGTIIAIALSGM